ncbi:hypothetical protein ABENE_18910 [Asticcacaulis benevestitus DSM 16100 = ATCC BAA-896]|uniref:Uncharacterized protein n=1 Tax=Asticcacaulis benevestitus DSM 16100 = ATCC BAA-896 TaxID=1121022 RepID=V4PBK2_9CAUL|nr:hypothetical protein ABENE_18910 [Asticcacaulis benevestitus DSM 16100 = ATCC BAA-896]
MCASKIDTKKLSQTIEGETLVVDRRCKRDDRAHDKGADDKHEGLAVALT